MKIKQNCRSCGTTGVYRGFAEPLGVGVICSDCGGEGFILTEEGGVAPNAVFKARKRRDNVKRVHWSKGSRVSTGVGPTKHSVSYEEFLEGKRPLKW